ncbi:Crp/Fnr family transcriptional regulator [Micromonospora sp. NPDC049559]|uniref:Crp/Fnr family transcriptional regulator n=1 Tax=Micromonospora sp. NPDC049559 TaxID=3155923 RepID=UPI00341C17D7
MIDRGRFWSLLAPADRDALERIGQRRRYGSGEVLLHQAEPSNHILILLSGSVKVTCSDAEGREVVLALRGPGDILGEMEVMIEEAPRSAAIRTLRNEVDALVVPARRFVEFLDRHPAAWRSLYTVLALRLREANRNAREFGRTGVRQALARLLSDLARQHGEPVENGIAISVLSQDEIAACIWSSRDAVAHELQLLRRKGILSTGRRVVTVIDLPALDHIARRGDD